MTKSLRTILLTSLTAITVLCLALLAACVGETKLIKLSFETYGGTRIEAIEAEAGEDIADRLPADPVKEGYVFGGWYREEDCSGTRQSLPTIMPRESRTYYAKWNEAAVATLTLEAGNGGTLAVTSYEVAEGTNLSSFLADKAPTPEEGLAFGGWFIGDAQLSETLTMPANGLTLTAKYLASYTVNVYRMDVYGAYPAAAEVETGSGWYLEPYEYDAGRLYTIDETGAGSRVATDALGKNETFTVWLSRIPASLGFQANLPAGVIASGTVEGMEAYIGAEITMPDGNVYGLPANYRFAGWARSANGAVEFFAGETVKTEDIFTSDRNFVGLYARWEESLVDAFGGGDYLFLSLADETVVHLRRGPLEEAGTYAPDTKLFSFGDGVLSGKVVETDYFYYFRDLAGSTFVFGGEGEESLAFTGMDNVAYTTAAGTEKGTYTIDLITGEYVFEGENGTNFHFSLNFQYTEEDIVLVFNRETGAERGFYAYRLSDGTVDTSRLVLLDGMIDANGIGGAYLYTYDGAFHLAYSAFYYLNDDGFYTVIDVDSYELFLLNTMNYNGTVGGQRLKGVVQISDGINGAYCTYDEFLYEENPSFLPDGFGNATLNGAKGTYTIGTYSLWTYSSDGSLYEWADEWIVFTNASTREVTYIRFVYFAAAGEILYTTMKKAPEVVAWSDPAIKPYGSVYSSSSLPSNIQAVFYKYVDDQWYVFAWYHDVYVDLDVYANLDVGLVTDLGNGEYLFESANANHGGLYYYFRYNADGTVTVSLGNDVALSAPSLSDPEGGDVFIIDQWGTLHYGGKTYAYGEWERVFTPAYYDDFAETYVLLYFNLSDGNTIYLWYFYEWDTRIEYQTQGGYDENGNYFEQEVPIEVEYQINHYYVLEDAVYELRYELYPGQSSDFPLLWFLSEDYVAIAMFGNESFDYYFYFFGHVTEDGDGSFHFVLDEQYSPEGLVRDDVFLAFSEFTFRPEKDGYAYYYDEYDVFSVVNEDGSSFTMDGYGNATYRMASGVELEGIYDVLLYRDIEGGIEYFLTFTLSNGNTLYIIIDYVDETLSFHEAANASVYSWFSDSYIYYEDYVVLFGDMTADKAGTAYSAYDEELGTYVATGYTFTYFYTSTLRWTEYEITLPSRTYRIAVAVYSGMNIYMDAYGEAEAYETSDGGRLYTDGYTYAYELGESNVIYYGYFVTVNIIDDTTQGWTFSYDENGSQLIFAAYYAEVDGQIYTAQGEMYFDFNANRTALIARTMVFGTFAYFVSGAVSESTMYLDGHGGAVLRDGNRTVTDSGEYFVLADELTYVFVSETQTFRFTLSATVTRDEVYYIYSNLEDESVYVAADWSVLVLGGLRLTDDGYTVDATYINNYGFSYEGLFVFLTPNILKLELTNGRIIYFNIAGTEFAVNSDTFVIEDGVLYAYQGPSEIYELRIPDGVKEIAEGVFEGIQGGRFGAHNFVLDLNEVEIIGAYAFANIVDFMIEGNAISSEHLTYIGDYAFASMDDDAFSSLNSVYFPNVTYIGAYAFYGNNQFNLYSDKEPEMGRVKLDSIEYIGAYAFCINRWATVDTFLTLDLTDADVSKLVIDPTAFNPGPSSYGDVEEIGYPVLILVSANGAFSFIASLPDYLQSRVEIVGLSSENAIAGNSYFSLSANRYLVFGTEVGAFGLSKVTYYYTVSNGWYEDWASSDMVYASAVSGETTVYSLVDGEWKTFAVIGDPEAPTFTSDGDVFYKTNTEHEVTVKTESGSVLFVFAFTVNANVTETLAEVNVVFQTTNFDGHDGLGSTRFSTFDGSVELTYEIGNGTYTTVIYTADWTATTVLSSVTVYSEDGNYRGGFSGRLADGGGFWYLNSFEAKVGGEWSSYLSARVSRETGADGKPYFAFTYTDADGTVSSFVVRYVAGEAGNAYITVEATVQGTLVLEADGYRVKFLHSGNLAEMDELTEFAVYEDYGDYGFYSPVYGAAVVKVDTNVFTVSVSGASVVTRYTVTYFSATQRVTVVKTELPILKAETAHTQPESYYEVFFLVDEEGNIVEITGELVYWTYSSYFGYGDFSIAYSGEFVRDGNTFSITNKDGSTYVIAFTIDGGSYSVTVTRS